MAGGKGWNGEVKTDMSRVMEGEGEKEGGAEPNRRFFATDIENLEGR